MAFSKLKAKLREAVARNVNDLSDVIAETIYKFTNIDCQNYFAATG